jgi:uncharacterized protein (TIGR01777 family)
MKVLIAGGSGFMGSAFTKLLRSAGYTVSILTRKKPNNQDEIHWDGKTIDVWSDCIAEMDAVINLTGYGLEHWPWTKSQKQRFVDSRVIPGAALVTAIRKSQHRPAVLLQISGINYYGTHGDSIADERTPPADDFLAQLTVKWEAATQPVEEMGVRRVVARSAVVLDSRGGLFPLMALPVRLFIGGPLGGGEQAVPWIHLADQIEALRFLIEDADANGVYNLISPSQTSNKEFMRGIAKILHRPYWFPTPATLLKIVLGEMSSLVVEGRYSQPKRLLESGFHFQYSTIDSALLDLFGNVRS